MDTTTVQIMKTKLDKTQFSSLLEMYKYIQLKLLHDGELVETGGLVLQDLDPDKQEQYKKEISQFDVSNFVDF